MSKPASNDLAQLGAAIDQKFADVNARLDSQEAATVATSTRVDSVVVGITNLMDRVTAIEAPTPVPVPDTVPTPPNQPPLFDQWKADIIKYADLHAAKILDTSLPITDRLGLYYYDAGRIYHQLARYFGRPDYITVRDVAVQLYRDQHLMPLSGRMAGWDIFPDGLYLHYLDTGDLASRQALLLLSLNAAYAQKGEPIRTWLGGLARSREAAYNLRTDILAEKLGSADTDIEELKDICLGHLAQWRAILDGTNATPSNEYQTVEDCRCFMVGLTCEALIERTSKVHATTEVLTSIHDSITETLNLLWEKMYLHDAKTMKYTDREIPNVGGPTPAPDLNMLIAPAYAWIGQRDRADLLFQGSVEGAYLAGHKQFNQSVRWVWDYLQWRQP